MADYEIDTDPAKNRLYLTLDGHFDATTVSRAADEVIAASSSLDPGFGMVNDISSFKPTTEDAAAHLKRGAKGTAENGLGVVVRVTGESITGELQWDQVSNEVTKEADYDIYKVETRADAEAVLDEQQ